MTSRSEEGGSLFAERKKRFLNFFLAFLFGTRFLFEVLLDAMDGDRTKVFFVALIALVCGCVLRDCLRVFPWRRGGEHEVYGPGGHGYALCWAFNLFVFCLAGLVNRADQGVGHLINNWLHVALGVAMVVWVVRTWPRESTVDHARSELSSALSEEGGDRE